MPTRKPRTEWRKEEYYGLVTPVECEKTDGLEGSSLFLSEKITKEISLSRRLHEGESMLWIRIDGHIERSTLCILSMFNDAQARKAWYIGCQKRKWV